MQILGLDFSQVDWNEMYTATKDTLSMLISSTLFTVILGLPLGIILYMTSRSEAKLSRSIYTALSLIVNILRSVPFVILMVSIFPFTKFVVGTSIGVLGSIPPLVISAAPFFARLVETSLREVDKGVIEAATAMGASKAQIVRKVLLPEARPGIIAGITITTVALVAYTAMSGLVGGGGLGDLAIRYGYQRYQPEVMLISVIILVLLVQVLQMIGDRLVIRSTKK